MKKVAFLLMLVFSLASCEDKVNLENNPIDSNIHIDLRVQLTVGSETIYLYCSTEKTYPCVNYPIITEQTLTSDKLKIDFLEVQKTDFCYTAIGPATASINLSTLKNGTYDIELNNGNFVNKGTLTVSESRISLDMKTEKGINITRGKLQRIPQNTYWGSIDHTRETASKANEYLTQVKELGALFNKQTPGHYFYYEIDNKGDIITRTEGSSRLSQNFIFQYEGNEEELKKKLKEVAKPYFEYGMYIRVETYKGESVDNWM